MHERPPIVGGIEMNDAGDDQRRAGKSQGGATRAVLPLQPDRHGEAARGDQQDRELNGRRGAHARLGEPADRPNHRVVARSREAGHYDDHPSQHRRSLRGEGERALLHSVVSGQRGGSQPTLGTLPVRQ
jgi:hypothetical protein